MLLVGHPTFSILCFSASIYFSGTMIISKFYGNIFGIYKNGIIDYNMNLNLWKEIHSYNIIEKTIYGYYHDGNKFEYNNIEKIDEIKELFEKNNVQKRDDK